MMRARHRTLRPTVQVRSVADPCHHFADVRKALPRGQGGTRDVDDVALTRYAAYLTAMNGEPSNRAGKIGGGMGDQEQSNQRYTADEGAALIEALLLRVQRVADHTAWGVFGVSDDYASILSTTQYARIAASNLRKRIEHTAELLGKTLPRRWFLLRVQVNRPDWRSADSPVTEEELYKSAVVE